MKFKKNVLAFAALAGAVSTLAGCGGKKPFDYTTLDFSVDTEGVAIKMWNPFGSDMEGFLAEVIEDFQDETGIEVELISKGSYDQLKDAITLGAGKDKIPHICLAYPDHMADYVNIDVILRLDYFFENDPDHDFAISDFYSDYMVENQTIEPKEDGSGYYTLGVPFNKSTELMFYNKTMVEWAKGLDDSIEIPATWDELATVCGKITTLLEQQQIFGYILGTDGNKYNKMADLPEGVDVVLKFDGITRDKFIPAYYDSQANFFITAIRQWGGTYTEVDYDTRRGYLAFDSQETINALTALDEIHDAGYLGIPAEFGGTAKYGSAYFKNWQSIFAIGSSAGSANNVPTGNAFETGVAPIPYHSADKKFAISQGTNLALLDHGTIPERIAAWKLLKYLSKYGNGKWSAFSGYFPACEYAVQSDDYQNIMMKANNPDYEQTQRPTAAQALKYYSAKVNNETYMSDSEGWIKFVDPAFVGSSSIREALNAAMGLLFISNYTPRQVIDYFYNDGSMSQYVRK